MDESEELAAEFIIMEQARELARYDELIERIQDDIRAVKDLLDGMEAKLWAKD